MCQATCYLLFINVAVGLDLLICTIIGRREINALRVKCAYCEKTMTSVIVERHVARCKVTVVPCPNNCELGLIRRMDLRSHLQSQCSLQDWECDMCGRNGTFQYITQHHVNTCNCITIDCPNIECGLRFQRWRLNEHIDYECEYAKIDCRLCNTQVERKNLNEHEKGAVHVLHGKVEELGRRVNFLLLLLIVIGVICALLVVHAMRATDDGKKCSSLLTSLLNNTMLFLYVYVFLSFGGTL